MNFIMKSYFVISLLISSTFSTFIDFQQDVEYNLHFIYKSIIEFESNETLPITTVFDAELQLQKLAKNEFYCKFNNIITQDVEFGEINKPFMVKMNGSRLESITYPSDWGRDDILHVHGMMKALLWDRTDIKRFLETKILNDDRIVYLPMGKCNCNIKINRDQGLLSIEAESTKDRCIVTDEERKILGDHINFVDDSSDSVVKLSYVQEDMTPEKLYVKLRLRFPNEEDSGYTDYTGKLTVVFQNTKQIETKIEVEGKLTTMIKENILDLNKDFH